MRKVSRFEQSKQSEQSRFQQTRAVWRAKQSKQIRASRQEQSRASRLEQSRVRKVSRFEQSKHAEQSRASVALIC